MNEHELRAIVRRVVQKSVQGAFQRPEPAQSPAPVSAPEPAMVPMTVPFGSHASHFMYMQLVNDNGGQCLIEPKVPCNHCGYCQSHGH